MALVDLCTDNFLVMYNRMQKSAMWLGKCIPRRRMKLLPGEKKLKPGQLSNRISHWEASPRGPIPHTSGSRRKGAATDRLTLTLLYTIFDRKINPFIFFLLMSGSAFIS